ncbi:hypothetical protein [Edaphobacter acidisoli]|nr:hypothetical protein [Edaphobacter acidisoli]
MVRVVEEKVQQADYSALSGQRQENGLVLCGYRKDCAILRIADIEQETPNSISGNFPSSVSSAI